ncbi:uncharacterized protein SCHCODRAFT_01212747 [Schizophyllum commune H4-8]|uniref:Uncharacterized protein n=1 Tax=Schizophyllum commune (strain H4-8 / FGSC 9210) TaxID=578458 RepID=D8Q5Y3_SCHCM|nr:uncharacterized protein SCHCODRAFT_01212747 [Schizophyllum commune H4-8]KAI5891976.1 hypothetical protein SCHCODRAFT_01212747 [Schizophyllum commune H4-8]
MAYAYTLDRSQLAWGVSKKEENATLEREAVRLLSLYFDSYTAEFPTIEEVKLASKMVQQGWLDNMGDEVPTEEEQSPQEAMDLSEEVAVPVESQSAVVEMWPPNDIFEDDEKYIFSSHPSFEQCHINPLPRETVKADQDAQKANAGYCPALRLRRMRQDFAFDSTNYQAYLARKAYDISVDEYYRSQNHILSPSDIASQRGSMREMPLRRWLLVRNAEAMRAPPPPTADE